MRKITELSKTILNWKTITTGLTLLLIAIIGLWICKANEGSSPFWFAAVLPSFIAILASSGVFAIFYEVFIRQQQTHFVLESIELRESLFKAGLDDISLNYKDYDYARSILSSTHIVIFVIYAQTWLNRYSTELQEFLSKDDRRLDVILPAFDNPFVPILAKHFAYTVSEMHAKMAEGIATCVIPVLGKDPTNVGGVRIYAHRSRCAYSLYRFNDEILVGPYYSSGVRRRAPMFTFVNRPGSLFAEFTDDIEKVTNENSTLIFDSKTKVDKLRDYLGTSLPANLSRAYSYIEDNQSNLAFGSQRGD